MAIIQVWSAPSCQTGAVCFGALAPWVSASGSEATGTPAGFRVTVMRDVADAASLAEGRCLRVLSQSRGEQWWFVSSVTDSDGDAGLVQVTAGPLRQLLTVRGLVRDGATFTFAPGKQTVTDLLNTYVLTNLAADGLDWITLGTVDYADTVEIGDLARVTRAAVLDAIEGQTGHTAVLTPTYTGGVLDGFTLDVLADVGAGLDTVPLSIGSDLATIQRTRDALRAATVVVPFSASGEPMDQTAWTVDSTSGSAPAWIVLRDPVSGNPWPIREDDQFVGAYLQQRDGTRSQITDSRASDSAVQIASVGSIVAGDEVTIVRDTDGRPVVEIASPAGVASSRGRLVGTVSTRAGDVRRNFVQNGVLEGWTALNAVPGWQTGGSTGTAGAWRYPRNTPLTWTAELGAALVGGNVYTSLTIQNAPANSIVLATELLRVGPLLGTSQSVTVAQTSGIYQADGSGTVVIPVNGVTAATSYGIGTEVELTGPRRPVSFPDDGLTLPDVMYLYGSASYSTPGITFNRMQTLPVEVYYDPGRPYLNAAAGCSFVNRSGSTATPSTHLLIVNDPAGTPSLLASDTSADVANNTTAHETLLASTLLASSRTVSLGISTGNFGAVAPFVRWASLWLDTAADTNIGATRTSGSNALWHRAQDVLASAASGTRYVVRGVDLARLQQEHGALALGQSVRLRSELLGVDATVKIVKLDYDFAQTETLNLELGAITPRLTGVTVTL